MRHPIVHALWLCLGFLGLQARAQTQTDVAPPPLAGSVIVSDEPYAWDKLTGVARVGETDVFLQQLSGGKPAAAIAFGVIGTVASIRAINKKTEEMANRLTSIGEFDISAKISERVAALAPNLQATTPPTMSLTGALLIRIDWDNQVRSSLLITATDTTSRGGWSKGYFYHFERVVEPANFQADGGRYLLEALSRELDPAIATTMTILLDDFAGWLPEGSPVTVTSRFLMPIAQVIPYFEGLDLGVRDDLAILRLDGRRGMVRFPTVDGVHLLKQRQFQVVARP